MPGKGGVPDDLQDNTNPDGPAQLSSHGKYAGVKQKGGEFDKEISWISDQCFSFQNLINMMS